MLRFRLLSKTITTLNVELLNHYFLTCFIRLLRLFTLLFGVTMWELNVVFQMWCGSTCNSWGRRLVSVCVTRCSAEMMVSRQSGGFAFLRRSSWTNRCLALANRENLVSSNNYLQNTIFYITVYFLNIVYLLLFWVCKYNLLLDEQSYYVIWIIYKPNCLIRK